MCGAVLPGAALVRPGAALEARWKAGQAAAVLALELALVLAWKAGQGPAVIAAVIGAVIAVMPAVIAAVIEVICGDSAVIVLTYHRSPFSLSSTAYSCLAAVIAVIFWLTQILRRECI